MILLCHPQYESVTIKFVIKEYHNSNQRVVLQIHMYKFLNNQHSCKNQNMKKHENSKIFHLLYHQ